MAPLWICPNCETENEAEICEVCGEATPVNPPVAEHTSPEGDDGKYAGDSAAEPYACYPTSCLTSLSGWTIGCLAAAFLLCFVPSAGRSTVSMAFSIPTNIGDTEPFLCFVAIVVNLIALIVCCIRKCKTVMGYIWLGADLAIAILFSFVQTIYPNDAAYLWLYPFLIAAALALYYLKHKKQLRPCDSGSYPPREPDSASESYTPCESDSESEPHESPTGSGIIKSTMPRAIMPESKKESVDAASPTSESKPATELRSTMRSTKRPKQQV